MSLDELVPCIPALRADEAELQLEARAFAESRLAPGAGKWEAGGAIPADVISELCALGLGGATLPRDVGGAGMTHVGALAVFEELARGDMAVGFALLCQNSCARSIWLHGTPAQRDEWLPSLLSGAELGAYAITEPGAGSDPAGMASTATERDGGFVLDGHKTWISNAPVAGLFVTSVKTDPDLGARGVSTFVVARGTAGLEVGARLSTLGARALTVGEVHFDGCRV
ncbi:MAG: acyl-CoA dehydrogenase family protein, partial [Gaiellales bacterium]